jgi:hypothetical protein
VPVDIPDTTDGPVRALSFLCACFMDAPADCRTRFQMHKTTGVGIETVAKYTKSRTF